MHSFICRQAGTQGQQHSVAGVYDALYSFPGASRHKADCTTCSNSWFDAQHTLVFLISEVCHLACLFNPRIPNHCIREASLADLEYTASRSVAYLDNVWRSAVDSVDFTLEGDGVGGALCLLHALQVVQISYTLQPFDLDVVNGCHSVVGVQSTCEAHGAAAGVCDLNLLGEGRSSDRNLGTQLKCMRVGGMALTIVLQHHCDTVLALALYLKGSVTYKAMLSWHGAHHAELREADWDTTPNSLRRLKQSLFADEHQVLPIRALPADHMASMVTDLH